MQSSALQKCKSAVIYFITLGLLPWKCLGVILSLHHGTFASYVYHEYILMLSSGSLCRPVFLIQISNNILPTPLLAFKFLVACHLDFPLPSRSFGYSKSNLPLPARKNIENLTI
jgi:hypothetical protein